MNNEQTNFQIKLILVIGKLMVLCAMEIFNVHRKDGGHCSGTINIKFSIFLVPFLIIMQADTLITSVWGVR